MKTKLAKIDIARILLGFGVALAGTLPLGAATFTINLTTAGASDNTHSGAVGGQFQVTQVPDQSTGTGVINPFVRLQGQGTERGFNQDGAVEMDEKTGTWTHSLLLSAVPVVNLGGIAYREFLLDVNQNTGGTNELLSLNQIQIFGSAAPLTTAASEQLGAANVSPFVTFSGASPVFTLNAANNFALQILLDYSLNAGSGSGDMLLYVRDTAFTGAGQYVTLFSQFGNPPGSSSTNDGFEEWAVIGAPTVPDGGSTIALLGGALVLMAAFSRRAGSLLGV